MAKYVLCAIVRNDSNSSMDQFNYSEMCAKGYECVLTTKTNKCRCGRSEAVDDVSNISVMKSIVIVKVKE